MRESPGEAANGRAFVQGDGDEGAAPERSMEQALRQQGWYRHHLYTARALLGRVLINAQIAGPLWRDKRTRFAHFEDFRL